MPLLKRNKEKPQIDDVTFYLKKLEKGKLKPKWSEESKLMKIRTEISETEKQ